MDADLLMLAIRSGGQPDSAKPALSPKHQAALRTYLRSVAATARTQADLLESLAADLGTVDYSENHIPGPKSLSPSQIKSVWDGVNDQAKRLLGAFVRCGGAIS